jgi:hypothetical protein
MSGVTAAHLKAWIRFVPTKDGYGVPLFSAGGNHLLIPRTDAGLRIQSFSDFYNESKFPISNELPYGASRHLYKINDKVPIPFIMAGKCDVIDPDIGLDELDRRLGTASGTEAADLLREAITDAHASSLHAQASRENDIGLREGVSFSDPPRPNRFSPLAIEKSSDGGVQVALGVDPMPIRMGHQAQFSVEISNFLTVPLHEIECYAVFVNELFSLSPSQSPRGLNRRWASLVVGRSVIWNQMIRPVRDIRGMTEELSVTVVYYLGPIKNSKQSIHVTCDLVII